MWFGRGATMYPDTWRHMWTDVWGRAPTGGTMERRTLGLGRKGVWEKHMLGLGREGG